MCILQARAGAGAGPEPVRLHAQHVAMRAPRRPQQTFEKESRRETATFIRFPGTFLWPERARLQFEPGTPELANVYPIFFVGFAANFITAFSCEKLCLQGLFYLHFHHTLRSAISPDST